LFTWSISPCSVNHHALGQVPHLPGKHIEDCQKEISIHISCPSCRSANSGKSKSTMKSHSNASVFTSVRTQITITCS